MLRRLACNGYFWLLLFSVPLFVYHTVRPFDYVKIWADSHDYLEMVDMDLSDPQGLSTLRPWGYAAFLKLYVLAFEDWAPTHSWWVVFGDQDRQWLEECQARQLAPGCWMVFEKIEEPWAYLPTCHLWLHVISVLVFYAGLRQLNFPAAAGVLMCLPILYYDYLDLGLHSLLADAPGQAFLLLTIGSFFFVLRKPTRLLRWACLAVGVFASYHTRAAFQFLLVMLPLATLVLGSCSGAVRKYRFAMTGVMLAVCWLPYFAYCGWRHHVVGQFSLVACTGFQFSGFPGLLLTEEMLPDMPPEFQSLAKAIVDRRDDDDAQEQCRHWTFVMGGRAHDWIPPLEKGQAVSELDYARVQDEYSWVVWQVLWPWADDEYKGPTRNDKYLQADRHFMAFSLEFIRQHPELYLMCVLKGWRAAILFALERVVLRVSLVLCAALAILLSLTQGSLRVKGMKESPGELSVRRRFAVLAITALTFFIFKVQLTAMSAAVMKHGDVDGRYIDTASLLLPCLPMLGVYFLGRYVMPALRSRGRETIAP